MNLQTLHLDRSDSPFSHLLDGKMQAVVLIVNFCSRSWNSTVSIENESTDSFHFFLFKVEVEEFFA